jgi:putative peptide zinc metalloprotease protein
LVLTHVRSRAAVLAGGLAVALGVGTEPMLAVPLAAGVVAMLTYDQLGSGRPPWWPARQLSNDAAAPGGSPAGGRRPALVTPRYGTADPAVWLAVTLLLTLGAFGAVLTDDRGGVALDRPERAVLLVLIVLVVVAGLVCTGCVHRPSPPVRCWPWPWCRGEGPSGLCWWRSWARSVSPCW